jgi:hypothetical protein
VLAAFDAFLGNDQGRSLYEYYCRKTPLYDRFYQLHREWRVHGRVGQYRLRCATHEHLVGCADCVG